MKQIEIFGDNRYENFTKTRIGCRGIILDDGKILVSNEEKTDYWLIPGGGLEDGETAEECCIREILEETGYIVKPVKQFLTVNEYYQDYKYISHYFICEIAGRGKQNLTYSEKERGLVPKWVDLRAFIKIVANYKAYAQTNEDKRGSYLREYTALNEYLRICNEL